MLRHGKKHKTLGNGFTLIAGRILADRKPATVQLVHTRACGNIVKEVATYTDDHIVLRAANRHTAPAVHELLIALGYTEIAHRELLMTRPEVKIPAKTTD